jgi:hypothetical protein
MLGGSLYNTLVLTPIMYWIIFCIKCKFIVIRLGVKPCQLKQMNQYINDVNMFIWIPSVKIEAMALLKNG